jgi:hypothetical protein
MRLISRLDSDYNGLGNGGTVWKPKQHPWAGLAKESQEMMSMVVKL